ncbi:hypothetical protein [Nonomuraea sp. NPDC049028]|uniref:hypothetical protein n=1 Tax=Nonomuraea sp. NPDC049028 TaxID=3364348 RepID=UPI003713123C
MLSTKLIGIADSIKTPSELDARHDILSPRLTSITDVALNAFTALQEADAFYSLSRRKAAIKAVTKLYQELQAWTPATR